MAEGMLADPKLEVANVAAATLSGMLKAAPAEAAAATRARFLDAANVATSSKRKARRRGASSAGADSGRLLGLNFLWSLTLFRLISDIQRPAAAASLPTCSRLDTCAVGQAVAGDLCSLSIDQHVHRFGL